MAPSYGELPTDFHVIQGSTRRVVLCGSVALKFARLNSSQGPQAGLDANRLEAERWHTVDDDLRSVLCPVLYCSPDHALLVMQRADPMAPEIFDPDRAMGLVFSETSSIDCEFKAEGWGILDGRWVVVDYGNPD
jgi:hypothetical protein